MIVVPVAARYAGGHRQIKRQLQERDDRIPGQVWRNVGTTLAAEPVGRLIGQVGRKENHGVAGVLDVNKSHRAPVVAAVV